MPVLQPLSSSIRSFRIRFFQKADAAHRKMAEMPMLQLSDQTSRMMTQQQNRCRGIAARLLTKHTLQLLVGSPCLHYCNTKPSSPRTNPPSNLRNRHCNRMAWKTSHSHRLDSDNPCRGLCSTIPSWPPTNLLASLRNHQRNCMDRLVAPQAVAR